MHPVIALLLVVFVVALILLSSALPNFESDNLVAVSSKDVEILMSTASDPCVSAEEFRRREEALREKYGFQADDLQLLVVTTPAWELFIVHHFISPPGLA